MTATHKLIKLETKHYPSSSLAYSISYTCNCGKRGTITDGRTGATLSRARSAHRRHAAKAAA